MYISDFVEEIFKYLIIKIISILSLFFLIFLISKKEKNITPITHEKRRSTDIFSNKMLIEGHRGVYKEIFQNTMESFSKAIEYDIDCIETDVWMTKDKVLVLVHGSGPWGRLKKFYNVSRSVTNLTWKQISKYRSVKDKLKMPKLEDLLKLAKNKIIINLEIKDPRIDIVFPKITKLIEKYDFHDQIFFTSFFNEYYNKTVQYNKKKRKNIIFQFAYRENVTYSQFDFNKKGNIMSIYWKNITKEICDKAHANGMAVSASLRFDKESARIYKKLIEDGVDAISVNEPSFAKKYRDFYYKKHNVKIKN